jgi:hypothetical protein
MQIVTKLAQKVTEKQGDTIAWYAAFFCLGYVAAKVLPRLWGTYNAWCFPIV